MELVESSAMSIAFKLQMRGCVSEEKAISALRRKHRGMSKHDASNLIRLASSVLSAAISFLNPSTAKLKLGVNAGRALLPEAIPEIDEMFRLASPQCSESMRHSAVKWAQLYHSR